MNDAESDLERLDRVLETAVNGPVMMRELCEGLDAADAERKPGVGKLSVLEHLTHLVDMERSTFGRRIRAFLDQERPRLEHLDMDHFVEPSHWEGRSAVDILDEWEAERGANLERVRSAGPEHWARVGTQPDVGKVSFLQVVEQWARHDGEHLRQVEILVMNSRERNLP